MAINLVIVLKDTVAATVRAVIVIRERNFEVVVVLSHQIEMDESDILLKAVFIVENGLFF